MTRTEIRDLFGRNRSGEELDRIMEVLAEASRIRVKPACNTLGGA